MRKKLLTLAIGVAALAATLVPSSPALAAGKGGYCYYYQSGDTYYVDTYDRDGTYKSTHATKNAPKSCYPY